MKKLIFGLMSLTTLSAMAVDTSWEAKETISHFREVELCMEENTIKMNRLYDHSVIAVFNLKFSDSNIISTHSALAKALEEKCLDASSVMGIKSEDEKSLEVLSVKLKKKKS